MKIKINNVEFLKIKRFQDKNTMTFIGDSLRELENVDGVISVYTDDDFLMQEINSKDYLRTIIGVDNIQLTNIPEPVITPVFESKTFTPRELREIAYESDAIIEYEGSTITVDEANKIYLQYLVEGNTEKTEALSALVVEAKAIIRAKYPDEM